MFNVGSVQGYLKLNTTGWNAPMKSATASINTLSRTFLRMGAVAVGSLLLIEREFGRFDKAIRHATSVSETTEEQFKQMSEMALDASVKWNKAATNTAQGFYFLGSAGLTVTERLQAFNDVIMLSRAMGSELAQTVEGTVDVVRAFGLEFADISTIADQLTKTVISSNLTFRILTKSLSYASSTARLTNNTLADTTAMLGIMANAGIKGSMAGTVLRRAMTNLMAPSTAMASIIEEMGLNIYDTAGKMIPFIDILGEISDRLRTASDEYKNMVFRTLFGQRAIAGQIVLFNYGSKAIQAYSDSIRDAGGTTRRVAERQMKAFSEQLGRLWRELQRVAITAGGLLAPAIERIANRVQESLVGFRDYIQANSEAVAETMKWTAAISALLVLGAPLLMLVSSFTTSMIALAAIIANPFVALIGILFVVRSVWKSTFDRGGELSIALDNFTKKLQDWLVNSLGVFGKAIIWVGKAAGWAIKSTVEGWSEILNLTGKMLRATVDEAEITTTELGDVAKAGIDVLKPLMDSVKAQLREFATGLGGVLPEGLMNALRTLEELYRTFMTEPVKAIEEAEKPLKELIGAIEDEAAEVSKSFAMYWKNAMDAVMSDTRKWHDVLVGALGEIRDEWTNTMTNFMNDTANMARTVENFLEQMFLNILHSFNRMAAEMLANKLFLATFGKILGEGYRPPYETAIPWTEKETKSISDIIEPLDLGFQAGGGVGKMVPVVINVENTGVPANLRVTRQQFDGKRYIISAVMEEMDTNPNFRNRLKG